MPVSNVKRVCVDIFSQAWDLLNQERPKRNIVFCLVFQLFETKSAKLPSMAMDDDGESKRKMRERGERGREGRQKHIKRKDRGWGKGGR